MFGSGMLFRGLVDAAREQDCFFCGRTATRPVCEACRASLIPLERPACPGCALPSPSGGLCGRCLAHPPAFDSTVAALSYGAPLDHALHDYKYRRALGLTGFLSGLLDAAIGKDMEPVDLVIPMPLAKRRLFERGFNQALELARPIAARRRIAVEARAARRVLDTLPQTALPLEARARNVKGAFACDRPLHGLRVAVVDDVMTTGATLGELARALKTAGAARVSNWVVARTPPPGG